MFQQLLTRHWSSPSSQMQLMCKSHKTETLCALFIPVTSQYREPDSFQTTSNEAYNVGKRQTGRGGGEIEAVEGEYEALPPTSSQPNTTAAGDYETV